jgi:hypothetical protein
MFKKIIYILRNNFLTVRDNKEIAKYKKILKKCKGTLIKISA